MRHSHRKDSAGQSELAPDLGTRHLDAHCLPSFTYKTAEVAVAGSSADTATAQSAYKLGQALSELLRSGHKTAAQIVRKEWSGVATPKQL